MDLLGQDFEALVAENDCLALSRFGNWRHDGEMISSVQRDRLGDHPHIALKVIEPGAHIVETLPHKRFDGGGGVQKMLEGGFQDVKPTADALTKPNRHLAACRGFALARW